MPNRKPKNKVYAVAVGRTVGVFDTWAECQAQTSGFKGTIFKSFATQQEALAFLAQHHNGGDAEKQGGCKRKWQEPSGNNDNNESTSKGDEPLVVSEAPAKSNDNHLENAYDANKNPKVDPPPPPPPPLSATTTRLHIHVHVMFDGGSRGNPGLAGAGARVVCKQTRIADANNNNQKRARVEWEQLRVTEIRHYMGTPFTNNQAEYQGLVMGLEQAVGDVQQVLQQTVSLEGGKTPLRVQVDCLIQGDSQLILCQMRGEYQVKHAALKPYYRQAQELMRRLHQELTPNTAEQPNNNNNNIVVNSSLEHVRRESNARADALANQAMDARRSWTTVTVDGQLVREEQGEQE